jgi:hypothetical protein
MSKTYAGQIKELEKLTASVAANASELPPSETYLKALEGLLPEVRSLIVQQAFHQARKQEISKRLKALLVEADKVAKVLHMMLKQRFGADNEKLVEFGLQPFRRRSRKAKPVPPPEGPPEPASNPSNSAV